MTPIIHGKGALLYTSNIYPTLYIPLYRSCTAGGGGGGGGDNKFRACLSKNEDNINS